MEFLTQPLTWLILVLVFSSLSYIAFIEIKYEKKLAQVMFEKFNKYRMNVVTEKTFRNLYFSSKIIKRTVVDRTKFSKLLQHDGDQLIEGATFNEQHRVWNFDIPTRMLHHLNTFRIENDNLKVIAISYNFERISNLLKFIEIFLKTVPNGVYAVAMNKTWVIMQKHSSGQVLCSFDRQAEKGPKVA